MHRRLCHTLRSAGGRLSAVALLAVGFCLIWARAGPADTAIVVRGRSADSDCGPAPRVCVLPFFDSAAPQGFDPDLAALLENALRRESDLRIVSAWPDRKWMYQVEPWLIRYGWPGPEEEPEADIYFRLRRVWVERAAGLGPADFLVAGRIVRTGSLATLLADILPASAGNSGERVASLVGEAQQAEEIPAAMEKLAAAAADVLGRDRSRRCLNQIWARYRSGSWPIERAIQEAQARTDEHPKCLECGLLLLGLLEEGGEHYAEQAEAAARSLVVAWEDWTDETRRTASAYNLDPFVFLCEREAARADWAAVEATARLGSQTLPLNSLSYGKWRARSLFERGLWKDARRELEVLARSAPADPDIRTWLEQATEEIRSRGIEEDPNPKTPENSFAPSENPPAPVRLDDVRETL